MKLYYKNNYFVECITTGSVVVVVFVVLRVLLVYCTALDSRLLRLDAISEFISCNTLSISCRVVSPSLPCKRKQYKILQHEQQPYAYDTSIPHENRHVFSQEKTIPREY